MTVKQFKYSTFKDPQSQLKWLNKGMFASEEKTFNENLKDLKKYPLKPDQLEIFQVNIGYQCNQTCSHCHVDAGPHRTEMMTKEVMGMCVDVIRNNNFKTVDITGGAPEMHKLFRWFVEQISDLVDEIIVRSNLTIIESNKKYHDLPYFFKSHNIRVVSSLPYFEKKRTDIQRGEGVFSNSIKALKRLNQVGYGKSDSDLILDLVYNPSGAFLPDNQENLEVSFKRNLLTNFNIEFNSLLAITNLPISRFLDFLIESDNYEDYMYKLSDSFNPAAINGLMCKNTLSVDWQGYMYDCDFNQMLKLRTADKGDSHISNFNANQLADRTIVTNQHCFGCTAGEGSSCQGVVV